jgi:NAD kinase
MSRLESGGGPGRARREQVVIVTRKTELETLVERFNTVPQARFYLEHAGQDFESIERAHRDYHSVLEAVRAVVPAGLKSQVIERGVLPQFSFSDSDLVVTVGPNGLVVNTAKYLDQQPVIAVNPDPAFEEGILARHEPARAARAIAAAVSGEASVQGVTMAQADLEDGQRLLAVNDLFVGPRSHVSARYRLEQGERAEEQSSSGIIISTGAGSTGWLQSIYVGAAGVVRALGGRVAAPPDDGRIPWDADQLVYAVREPWPSRHSGTDMVFGVVTRERPLVISSRMPDHGTIFGDGMQSDYLAFNSGSSAVVSIAERRLWLVS